MRDNKVETHHSHFYHSYFRGYTEARVPREDGHGDRIVRVYTEDYIVSGLDAGREILSRIIYMVLVLAAAFLFIYGGSGPAASGRAVYADLAVAVTIIVLFLCFAVAIFYMARPMRMTVYHYDSTSKRLIKFSAAAAICAAASFVFHLIDCIISGDTAYTGIFCYLAAAVIMLAVYLIEQRKPYETVANNNEVPEDGNKIW